MPQSILVTGGAGFIGSHLIERLLRDRDAQVVCLDDFNDYYDPARKRANAALFENEPRVTVVEGSFCDRELVARLLSEHDVDQIVHLGAYAGVRYSVENPWPYQKNNVEGTLVLLEAVRKRPVRRFVFVSSSSVYGRGAESPFREDAPLGTPLSPYCVSKRAGELLCANYHDLFQTPTVCLRLFSVYGPRLRPDLAMSIFTSAILDGRPVPLFGDGSIRRDFTHVSDVCTSILASLDCERAVGECVNIGHHAPVSMRELITAIENAAGKQAVIDHQPSRPEEMEVTCADLSKARELLGYAPAVAFDDGVREFVDWFQSHG